MAIVSGAYYGNQFVLQPAAYTNSSITTSGYLFNQGFLGYDEPPPIVVAKPKPTAIERLEQEVDKVCARARMSAN